MGDFPFQTGVVIALIAGVLGGVRLLTPTPAPKTPRADTAAHLPAATVSKAAPETLLDDSNGVLDSFYRALARTESQDPGAMTRVVHYGDSPTTADLITGDIRGILQARFGDGGHGFILPAKPWAWYHHEGATVEGKGWLMQPASRFEKHDGLFGLGGVSFVGANATSRIEFADGQNVFELWFLRQPNGGTAYLSADGAELGQVDTAGEAGAGFATFETKVPAHLLELRVTRGRVRIFGVSAERAGPGLVYDTLGLNGASIGVFSRMFNEPHLAAELQHRNPDLLILNYGTNEADFGSFVESPQYEKDLREALRRLRAALPETAILVMSPMDRGYKNSAGEVETMPTIPEIVATQRRVAQDTGCGFFDTFRAMGGAGTMARWYAARPRLVSADFIHPNPAAGKQVAAAFTRELVGGLDRYKVGHPSTPAVR
jgi:lysophospholipase L1-like esterase